MDYQIISPSLDGVLSHESLAYDGVRRPIELLRVLDGPAVKGVKPVLNEDESEQNRKTLEEYFHDLYGVFMKKLSFFAIESETSAGDTIQLHAMLQELIKVKNLLGR